jgi:hypothetical protein
MLCLSYYCLYSFFNKIRDKAEQILPRSEGWWRGEGGGTGQWGEMAQTMYAHMNK